MEPQNTELRRLLRTREVGGKVSLFVLPGCRWPQGCPPSALAPMCHEYGLISIISFGKASRRNDACRFARPSVNQFHISLWFLDLRITSSPGAHERMPSSRGKGYLA